MRKSLFLLRIFILFCSFPCLAQTYKYLGVEDGLSNRRVYAIQKDSKGYMWFLTHDGVDRYDGKNFRHYKLMDGNEEINSMINLNWLYTDAEGNLWEIGKMGRVFRYDRKYGQFQLEYKLPVDESDKRNIPVTYSFIDADGTVWLCNQKVVYLYDSHSRKTQAIDNPFGECITSIAQIAPGSYFIGTDKGIHWAELTKDGLKEIPRKELDSLKVQVNEIFYHRPTRKLFIGTFLRGMFVYDIKERQMMHLRAGLTDVSINRIKQFNEEEILIATDGAGVYKTNAGTLESSPYIIADYNRPNGMNGNTVNDLYIDGERIWLANYPIGITVRNNLYADYHWIKHSIGNPQSLVNDQVNAIIEDSDGDLWFATNNGISLYLSESGKWHSFLSVFDNDSQIKNTTFISLCEVSPGIIWAGGYNSGIYQIDKRQMKVNLFSPSLFGGENYRPDKYIRAIMKASNGMIWSGGYYNLKEIDYENKSIRYFPELNGITTLIEKDEQHIWVGTATGLYLLDKQSGEYRDIPIPAESHYIYSLHQATDSTLYIGTNNSGLLIYNTQTDTFKHYHKDNCSLISNNIYSIVSDEESSIFLSTEHGLTRFNPQEEKFLNWTKEQGLSSVHFNSASGTQRKNGNFIFGSTEGAIEFSKDMSLPRNYEFKVVFNELRVLYQTVYPNDEGSPLSADIDETETLHLKYKQNIFSLEVSSVNYDYPSLVLYSWKLEGFYDGWSEPGRENIINFTNLSPGQYTLRVRAISNEDQRIVLKERSMNIVIEQPIWLSIWAILLYALILCTIAIMVFRIIIMRKQRKVSDEKIRFFINTAHDIRTPLTLIKAPLEELTEHETLTEEGIDNLNTALRNANTLLRLTTNLINFERADIYSNNIYISEHELGAYMADTVNAFRSYATTRHINLTYECDFHYLNVWIDKDKMDSILKNIISNALKYTPDGGDVHVHVYETENNWNVEVSDTGIGIPQNEQKNLFKMHFRGSNAINSKITGSGIGLLLVGKLVRIHKGKINFTSAEGKGSCVKVAFPKNKKSYHKASEHSTTTGQKPKPGKGNDMEQLIPSKNNTLEFSLEATNTPEAVGYEKALQLVQENERLPKILIVEDNDELREYLRRTLAEENRIQACSNGKSALSIVKEYYPDLIISDIMMPEMRGDELCQAIKNDIEISHIPIILLTALNTDKHIIDGLRTGADDYIVKPFNIGILRATIASLLANRALLRRKYGNLELDDEVRNNTECVNCTTDLDWKFILNIKKYVEENMDSPTFNIDVLCGMMNMSRSSFYNKLKALTNQAPADYVRLIRLKHSMKLLKEQKYTVTEIAEMTGFNDAKYFREVFKRYFNMSPSQYAQSGENTLTN